MDIGYFLKLMTEKGASDMFLTTGAPVNIKVEGKLYPLGNTGLPSGMAKKIAYSLMDEGQVPQFERDLELHNVRREILEGTTGKDWVLEAAHGTADLLIDRAAPSRNASKTCSGR